MFYINITVIDTLLRDDKIERISYRIAISFFFFFQTVYRPFVKRFPFFFRWNHLELSRSVHHNCKGATTHGVLKALRTK